MLHRKRGLEGWGRGKTASVKGLPLEQGGSALHAGGGEWEGRAGRRCRVCSEVHCWAGLGNGVTGVRRAERQSGDSPDTAGLLALKPAQTTAHKQSTRGVAFLSRTSPLGRKAEEVDNWTPTG